MEKLILEIVTPERRVVKEEVDEVVCPGIEGEFGVLPGHTPFLTALKIGELSYRVGDQRKYIAITWGYAEVDGSRVEILADQRAAPASGAGSRRPRGGGPSRCGRRLRGWRRAPPASFRGRSKIAPGSTTIPGEIETASQNGSPARDPAAKERGR